MDDKYLAIILERLLVCKKYKPKFGQRQEISFGEFQNMYGSDPFYAWFGLDNSLVYTAHRAAGGITSIYRQIGIGCEALFRQVLQDHLELNEAQTKWSYEISTSDNRKRRLSLDARIKLTDIASGAKRVAASIWLDEAAAHLQVAPEIRSVLKGAVFEVRQGYKSKDSKRQNADIANAATAYSQGYLPVMVILSTQIDRDIVERYQNAKWLTLQGYLSASPIHSTYAFMKNVIGYDLAGFFERNSNALKKSVEDILKTLLTSSNGND